MGKRVDAAMTVLSLITLVFALIFVALCGLFKRESARPKEEEDR